MLLAAPQYAGDALYDLVLVLHIVTVVWGIGGVGLNGFYAMQAKKRKGREGLAISEAMSAVAEVAQKLIYAIPVLGIFLVILSDGTWGFDQMWISLSFLLYILALGISLGVMHKVQHRMQELQRELLDGAGGGSAGGPPPQVAELERLGKRAGMAGAALNLLALAIVFLMVFKPGA